MCPLLSLPALGGALSQGGEHTVEPEMPHYQLNIAAAYLKLCNGIEAENACSKALAQHRSIKGYYRRAKARRMMARTEEAIKDLRAALKIHPSNAEALEELPSLSLMPSAPYPDEATSSSVGGTSVRPRTAPASERAQLPKPKSQKPLPFSRTKADDRKLKIVPIPVSSEVPTYVARDASSWWKSTQAQRVKDATTKTETFVYPSWEKYTVREVG